MYRAAAASRVRRPSRVWMVALFICTALVAAGCSGSRTDETSTTTGGSGEGIIDAGNCTESPTIPVEGDTIKLGTSLPQSGLYSAFAEILKGEQAYFDYLNDELGGVDVAGKKYKIDLVNKDDAYQADRTVENVNALINDDKVFALFNVVGTKNNLAIRDVVNEQCVPNLFLATGSPAWGNPKYPWILGSELVPYPLEAQAFVDYLQQNKPDAKVAILRAADDFGRAYSETFAKLIKGTKITIAKEETYNAEQSETQAQVTSLAATDADALLLGATLLACPNALSNVRDSGWKPLVYMSGTCTSKTLMTLAGPAGDGVLSVAPIMEPGNPKWDSNPNMQTYKQQLPKYAPDAELDNAIVAYGWTTAALLADTLARSPELTRLSVMETARTLKDVKDVGLLAPGVALNVSAKDRFLGETFNIVRFDTGKGYFDIVGDLIDADGTTRSVTPKNLIDG